MSKNKTIFSQITIGERKSSEYGTPLDFFQKLNNIFDFKLDPCSDEYGRLGTERRMTKRDNGLEWEWDDNTFINPPFGTKKGENILNWINYMKEESDKYPSFTYIMLLPARIESNWFQNAIFTDRLAYIYVIKGRLRFYNPEKNKNNDPHPIGSILYIRPGRNVTTDDFAKLQKDIPGLFIGITEQYI